MIFDCEDCFERHAQRRDRLVETWAVDGLAPALFPRRYKREAIEKNRESWFLAYIMDTDEQEKAKGKTVEVRFRRPSPQFLGFFAQE